MRTHGFGVDPTNLRLELRETHEQNYIIFPPVAYLSCCRECRGIRSGGEVGLDVTQRFELGFLALSVFHKVSGEIKHYTWFYVLPLWGDQSPCVFDNFR